MAVIAMVIVSITMSSNGKNLPKNSNNDTYNTQ